MSLFSLVVLQGGTALVLEPWMKRTSFRPLRMFPQCRYEAFFVPGFSSIFSAEITSSQPSFLSQIYSNREVEEAMTKIRDVLSDDKRDWELRVAAVRQPDPSLSRESVRCERPH